MKYVHENATKIFKLLEAISLSVNNQFMADDFQAFSC